MELEFQKDRLKMEIRHSDKQSLEFAKERRDLFKSVQGKVLPKYGFPGASGPSKMMQAFMPVNDDPLVKQHGLELNYLLGIENAPGQMIPGWTPPQFLQDVVAAAAAALGESQTATQSTLVTLEVKHAISGTKVEVQMQASSRTSLHDVKSSLSEKLGRPDLLADGRFVKKGGGGFASMKDTELLGERKLLLLLGVEL